MAVKTADTRLEERWRDILAVHARTMCEIDRTLHPHGLGASDFEVLDILATESPAEGDQCRVQNLVGRVHLSQSALSRLIARLEKDGLVERSVCAEDRRGVYVTLTRKGRDLHTEVLPLQRAVLERMLAERPGAATGTGRPAQGLSA
ncbi:MarR family transcriptional regulator [Streptomyces sp. NBC_00820]|uniref:MarR family winged helix-turn-helix transcriptional regulator n=1 Tax=Streptomyces sp. NBC_00820 TaxID=2975842 RepID=UPI002ED14452|nr:MarR family transcriptional regulator [Streptomyces sp. NBC_00820]